MSVRLAPPGGSFATFRTDRKSTRLNSSHLVISYAVLCLKKKKEGDVDGRGAAAPLGYRGRDRKLVIVDSEAELVRSIFRRYAELGSVRLLNEELEAQGSKGKAWTSASGRMMGGKPFARGALYRMLRNRTY